MNKSFICFIIFFLIQLNKVYSQSIIITNISQIYYSININGSGFKLSTITSITIGGIEINSKCYVTSDLDIRCTDLQSGIKSGVLVISNQGGNTASYNLILDPYIISLSKNVISPSGESITVTGRFFEDKDQFTGEDYQVFGVIGSSVSFKCQYIDDSTVIAPIPSGVGPAFTLYIMMDIVKISNGVKFSYSSPNILAFYQLNDQFTINVENINSDPSLNLIYFNNVPPFSPTTLENNNFTFTLDPTSQNGQIYFTSNNQISNKLNVNLAPVIKSITPSILNPDGSTLVTISGNYFSNINYVTGQNVIINFDYILDSSNPYKISITSTCSYIDSLHYSCSGIKGTGSSGSLVITKSLVPSSPFKFEFQSPIVIQSTSLYYQEPGNIIITANYFSLNDLKVLIENVECLNPVALDSSHIQCYYDASVEANQNGDALTIYLTSNSMTGSNKVFLYNEYYSCPNNCTDQSRGRCNQVNGNCICNDGFQGLDCSINKQTPLPPPQTNENGETILNGGSNNNFTVSIIYLREVDINGNQVKTIPMKSITWDNSSTRTLDDNSYYYRGTFSDDPVIVELNITYYKDQMDVDFAGDIISIPSNSIKYIITISNWEFNSILNTFQVIYLAKTNKYIQDDCNKGLYETNSTSSTNIHQSVSWFQINTANSVMDAKFSRRYYLDSSVKRSSVSILPLDDSIYNLINSTNDNNSSSNSSFNILASINTQYFKQSVVLDPSFSSLISSPSDSGCNQGISKWKIILISVLCSVFGVSILIAISFTLYRQHKFKIESKVIQAKLKALK